MKLGFSQPEIIPTATTLGLPTKGFVQRRVARAYDLVEENNVTEINDGIFRVRSQSEPQKSYIVNINRGHPSCDCPDGQRTINCKPRFSGSRKAGHRIASLLYLRQEIDALTITDETHNSCNQRGRWRVTDDQDKVVYHIYRDIKGNLICPCGRKSDCKHRKAIKEYISKNKIENECRTEFALEIQEKLNRHLNRLKHSGKESKDPSQRQLRLDNPFEESDSYDIDQIEGRRNVPILGIPQSGGDLAWKLSNGQYIISYQGVMALAQRHSIQFSVSIHDDANLVIAKASNGNQRVSGKEVRFCGLTTTASELAKRNAARQLLPLAEMEVEHPDEIGAVEKKAPLEAEFDWQTAYQKCRKAAGTQANVDITINELVKTGKLRQVRFSDSESGDNPSHYNRTEWLTIYNACKDDDDDDGGEKPPSSNPDLIGIGWKEKFRECKNAALNDTRFNWIKTDLMRENALRKAYPKYWTDQDFDLLKRSCALDTSLFNRKIGEHWVIQKEANFNDWDYSRRYRFWIVTKDTSRFSGLREKCFYCGQTKGQVSQLYDDLIYWEWFRYASYSTQGYHIKTVVCFDCLKTTKEDMTRRFDQLYHQSPGAVKTDGLPKPSEKFLQDFREVRQGGDAK